MLLRKPKKHPEWKQKKDNNSSHNGNASGRVGGQQHRSELDRIYKKEQKVKELEEVKKQVKHDTITKSKISANIHSILMSRLKK